MRMNPVSPTKIATPCRMSRCPAIAGPRGLCHGCSRAYERRRGTAAQRGYGAAWRKLRLRILVRDPTCKVRGCDEPSVEPDHIQPKVHGGSDDPANLRGTCVYHNRSRRPVRA